MKIFSGQSGNNENRKLLVNTVLRPVAKNACV